MLSNVLKASKLCVKELTDRDASVAVQKTLEKPNSRQTLITWKRNKMFYIRLKLTPQYIVRTSIISQQAAASLSLIELCFDFCVFLRK